MIVCHLSENYYCFVIEKDQLSDITFDDDKFQSIMIECDSVFNSHFTNTLRGWNTYGTPMFDIKVITTILRSISYVSLDTANTLVDFRGVIKYSRSQRRPHLLDRRLQSTLFQVVSLARVKNNWLIFSWVIILSLLQYVRATSKLSSLNLGLIDSKGVHIFSILSRILIQFQYQWSPNV